MKKGIGKRGRPPIKPWVESFIASMVLSERDKLPEERMPVKVLASEIQKRIRYRGEQPPELSTLEKRISTYRNRPDPECEPWNIFMRDDSIPPEALPKVVAASKRAREDHPYWRYLSIRQAKWIARLSAFEFPSEMQDYIFSLFSRFERLSRTVGKPHSFDRFDLFHDLLTAEPDDMHERLQSLANYLKNWLSEEARLTETKEGGKNDERHKTTQNERRHKKAR
jgi:hypothetical protein